MFIRQLSTSNPQVELVVPNVERDAPLSVGWLEGSHGRQTLKLMGVTDSENRASNLAAEKERVTAFLDDPGQYNWMIKVDDTVIGSVWVDLLPVHGQSAPSVSIMLGDASYRGRGIGQVAVQAVLDFLHAKGYTEIYARHLIDNASSASLFRRLGFVKDGDPYFDPADGLSWQNIALKIQNRS